MTHKTASTPTGSDSLTILLKYERLKKMVSWLLQHQEEIGGCDKVQVVFDCAGDKVKPSKTIYEDAI